MQMNEPAYRKLIEYDLEWLNKMSNCIEKQHIEAVLKDSIRLYYHEEEHGTE